MSKIDYSKWDHIDSEGEVEAPKLDSSSSKRPPQNPTIQLKGPPLDSEYFKCPATCFPKRPADEDVVFVALQGTDDEPPPNNSDADPKVGLGDGSFVSYKFYASNNASHELIQVVTIPTHTRNKGWFTRWAFPTHIVFSSPPSCTCPVSKAIQFPILCLRHYSIAQRLYDPNSFDREQRNDNIPATYMMVELKDGLAKPFWQKNVGSVTFARSDKKSLTMAQVDVLNDFIFNNLMDRYGSDDFKPEEYITKQRFSKYFDTYYKKDLGPSPYSD